MDMDLKKLVEEGVKAKDQRWELYTAYSEALEAQQQVRENLRKASIRTLGKPDSKGFPKKRPDLQIRYHLFSMANPHGYWVQCEGQPPLIPELGQGSFSSADALVAAYLHYAEGFPRELAILGGLI